MDCSMARSRSGDFGLMDYWRMYRAKGVRLPVEYFLQAHLFDLWNGIDTHSAMFHRDANAEPEWQGELRPYRCSWTREIKRVFEMLRNELGEEFEDYAFIDIGCGKGKVILAWSQFLRRENLRQRMLGIDFNELCIDVAVENQRIMRACDLAFQRADAGSFDYTQMGEKLVCYLYNPFNADTLRCVLAALEGVEPIVVYNNPVELAVLKDFGYEIFWKRMGWHPNVCTVALRKLASVKSQVAATKAVRA